MHDRHRSACILITPPSADVLTLAEIKAQLRVDHGDDDAVMQAAIDAAVGLLDPAAGGSLGRALRPQTWELRRAGFGSACGAIALPIPPLLTVDSVIYDDAGGGARSLVEDTDFVVLPGGVLGRAQIVPARGKSWPLTCQAPHSVRIRFTAGYPAPAPAAGDDPAVPETLPGPLKAWLKLTVGSLYENRESFTVGPSQAVAQLPDHIQQMPSRYRVF